MRSRRCNKNYNELLVRQKGSYIMKGKLLLNGALKLIAGLLMIGILLFIPAGTIYFWNAWLLMGLLFVPMLFVGIVLFVKAPELLAKRLNSQEKENEQKQVIGWSLLIFIGGFVIAGLDFRFEWARFADWIVIVASVIFVVAYGLYAEVMRENAYLSRTVEVQEGQTVISTGLYGIVRHPMYFATVLLFLSIPLVLGSYIGFIIFLVYPFLLVKRIRNEEKVLEEGLEGYREYKEKVKYRMIPFIW